MNNYKLFISFVGLKTFSRIFFFWY